MALIEHTRPVILQLQGVSKAFEHKEQRHAALSDINLNIMEGELFTVVGPSGCGKSTLLNIIAGLDAPDLGSISAVGNERRIVIFQEGALFPWLTVFENVEFGLKVAGVPKDQ